MILKAQRPGQATLRVNADMATEIEAARLLTFRAAWMLDQGRRVTKESSIAKLFSSEMAVRVANE
ncbi:MAG TPA: acyl-CoA dehydrogenase family protein, partial [Bryobacterales bacterium]|nr:acyl-CoA dehydrogenase family protein [Bryobacterales bacterium]